MNPIQFRSSGVGFAPAQTVQKAEAVQLPEQAAVKFSGIQVSGNATIQKNPDMVSLVAGVEERGQDQKTVQTALSAKAKALKEAFEGISSVKLEVVSTSFGVQKDYEWKGNQRVDKGYVGVAQYQVSAKNQPMEKLPEIAELLMNIATKAKATSIGQPSFTIGDYEAASSEAIGKAVAEAKAKAERAAKAAGIKLGDVQSIEIGSPAPYGRGVRGKTLGRVAMAMAESAGGGVDEDVFALAPQDVTSPTVTVTYAIGDGKKAAKAK